MVQRQKTDIPAQSVRQRESSPFRCLFCSIQALGGLDGTYLHWGGQSELGLQIQRLVFSINTLTDTFRNTI